MKKYKIKLPIYYGKITLLISKNLIFDSNHFLNINISEGIEAYSYKKEAHNYIIGIKKNGGLYNIVHEIVHIVNFIYEDHNIKLSKSNDEHQAYLTGYLFNEIYKKL